MVELHNWWVDLSFALMSFSIGNLYERYFLLNKMNVWDYQIYPSYGEFKMNK